MYTDKQCLCWKHRSHRVQKCKFHHDPTKNSLSQQQKKTKISLQVWQTLASVLSYLCCIVTKKNPLWCNHISCTAPFRSVFQQQFPVINSYFLPYSILYARTHYAPVHNFLEYVYWFVLRNWPPARKPNFCFSMLKKYQLSQMVAIFFNLQKAELCL